MTPADLSLLTMGELEAMAARMEAAAKTIRDAVAMLQPQRVAAPMSTPLSLDGPGGELTYAPAPIRPPSNKPVEWTPAELAEKERMKQQRLRELPDDIRALEEK